MIRVALAWAVFWIGDFASKILELHDAEWWIDFWYPVYSRLMQVSVQLQRDDIRGPWQKVELPADE